MIKSVVRELKKKISVSEPILITSHLNPDGDAIGSSLALYHFFKNLGYEATIVMPNDFPSFLKWLEGSDSILIYDNSPARANRVIEKAKIIFSLDYNGYGRIGEIGSRLLHSEAIKILIDHHPEPDNIFDYIISTVNTSSTAELIYGFIVEWNGKQSVSRIIAEALYTGIMTDTGSFSYNCNFSRTYEIVAHLIRTGIDGERIHRLIYDTFSEHRMRLLGYCLSEKLTVVHDLNLAYISLTKQELQRFNYQIGDSEGVVNYALSISRIQIAVLLIEREGYIRLSFRSKGDFAVNRIAREHFEGGGHRNAAGGNSYMPMDETLKKLIFVISENRKG